jgi:hypothetical protein
MREHAVLERLEQNHELIAALEESRRMAGSEKHRNRIDALLNDVDAAGLCNAGASASAAHEGVMSVLTH